MIFNSVIFSWLLVLSNAEFKCRRKMDLAVLLDCSASVAERKFAIFKKFAADLVKHFEISKERTNVAALSFSQYVHTGWKFSDDSSQGTVLKAIQSLPFEGSFTRLDLALQELQDATFRKVQGARSNDKDVKKVVVVLTDGFSSLGIDLTRRLSKNMERKGFKVFAVGTSDRLHRSVNKAELDELVSKPSEGHQLIMDLDKGSFNNSQVEKLAKRICKAE